MSINYELLKPFHIQQITRSCCSIASTVMILNAFKSKIPTEQFTQSNFLNEIKDINCLRYWYSKTATNYSKGVPITKFAHYLYEYSNHFKIPFKVKTKLQKDTGIKEFKKDLELVNQSNCHYMILNFKFPGYTSGHFSPLGSATDEQLIILDTDYYEEYREEFQVLEDEGELEYNIDDFFYNSFTKYRGYLLIEF